MTEPIYLGLSILDINKTLMHKFCYDFIKPKYRNRAKLCYMDTNSFVVYIETDDFYKDIVDYVEIWFDRSNYNEKIKDLFQLVRTKKIPGLFKDELEGKIMIEFVALRVKTYACLMSDDSEHNKTKGTKKMSNKKYTYV